MTEFEQWIYVWTAIIGVSLTTLLTRGSFILFGSQLRLPKIVDKALAYAPACALAAIMVPDLLWFKGRFHLDAANLRLLAACAAALVFFISRSLVLTIVMGMVAFSVLRLWATWVL